jgi:hypothetical protein
LKSHGSRTASRIVEESSKYIERQTRSTFNVDRRKTIEHHRDSEIDRVNFTTVGRGDRNVHKKFTQRRSRYSRCEFDPREHREKSSDRNVGLVAVARTRSLVRVPGGE